MKSSLWLRLKKKCYSRNKTPKTFVSGSAVRNYLLKDPIIDWLKLYGSKSSRDMSSNDKSNDSIFIRMGNRFEESVYKYLSRKYPRDTINLSKPIFNKDNSRDTIAAVNNKYPLIFQATVYDKHTNLGGVTDIIIKGSWLTKLFKVTPPNPDGYYVIDIKWSKITLCADGSHIRNSGRIPSYKGQLLIYTFALNSMLGIENCDVAYILGKSYSVTNTSFNNCFSKLGVIDYTGRDNQYVDDTEAAIKWLRQIRSSGHKWDIFTDIRLLPNMKNKYDDNFHKTKNNIAEKISDPTLIWNVSVKNRNIGLQNGVHSFKQKECCAEALGINNSYTENINNIVRVNNCNDILIIPSSLCEFIPKEVGVTEFYIDFETVNSCFLEGQQINIFESKVVSRIFMIGVGYFHGKSWVFKKFIMDKFSAKCENSIVDQFIKYVTKKTKNCKARFYYWSHIEKSLIVKNSESRRNKYSQFIEESEWIDLLQIFKKEKIAVRGAKNSLFARLAASARSVSAAVACPPPTRVHNGW